MSDAFRNSAIAHQNRRPKRRTSAAGCLRNEKDASVPLKAIIQLMYLPSERRKSRQLSDLPRR